MAPTKEELERELETLRQREDARREAETRRNQNYRRKQAARGREAINFWIDADLKRTVWEMAEADGRTLSAMMGTLLRAALARPRPPAPPVFQRAEAPAAAPPDTDALEPIRAAIEAGAEYPAAALGAWIENEKAAGRGFREMAEALNAAGIPTRRGAKWSRQNLNTFFNRL